MSILKDLLEQSVDPKETTVEKNEEIFHSIETLNNDIDYQTIVCDFDDIQENNEAIERLEEIGESLEKIIDITEDSLQDGGLTRTNANIIKITVDTLISPLGLSSPVLSEESFGAEGERLTATRVSLEEEKGTLTKIWDAIKAAFKKVREQISKWYSNIFNNVEKFAARNKKVKEAIDSISGKKAEVKEIEFDASKLLAGNQSGKDIEKNVNNLIKELDVFLIQKDYRSHLAKLVSDYKNFDPSKGAKEFAKSSASEVKALIGVSKTSTSTDVSKSLVVAGTNVVKHDILPGNNALYQYEATNDENIFISGWKLDKYNEKYPVKGKTKLPVMTQSDLDMLASLNAKLIDFIRNYKTNKDAMDKLREDVIKAGDQIAAKAKTADKEKASDMNKMLQVLRNFEGYINKPINELVSLTIQVINAIDNLIMVMVKTYA